MPQYKPIRASITSATTASLVKKHLVVQFALYYLSIGHLWKVKNNLSFESGCVRLQGGHLHEFLNNYSNDIFFFGIFWVPEVGNTADTPNPLDTQPG